MGYFIFTLEEKAPRFSRGFEILPQSGNLMYCYKINIKVSFV